MNYHDFVDSKRIKTEPVGFDYAGEVHPVLMPFQAAITRWMIKRGRAAAFEGCGSGKTLQQLEWSRIINEQIQKPGIIFAPLGVCEQTVEEARDKLGLRVQLCKDEGDLIDGINITNYEKLRHFNPDDFGSIAIDESSALKAFDGQFRKDITDFAKPIHFRSCWTATPAPNDLIELTNHAEFLDIMSGKEIIALFFTQDGNTTHQWRLKGHARKDFWKWMASWAVAIRKPSDLGFDDGDFILPPLHTHQITVQQNQPLEGQIFYMEAATLQERRQARRDSLKDRVQACADLVNSSDQQWLIWCDLNIEQDSLKKIFGDEAVSVQGSTPFDDRMTWEREWRTGKRRIMISKPAVFGWGMNWQHCRNMAFVGLSDSYEAMYQATRRCWRFGQKQEVNVHVITSEAEGAVVRNIKRKEDQASEMFDNMIAAMDGLQMGQSERNEMTYREDVAEGKGWKIFLGDSIKRIDEVESDSVGMMIMSPPFPGMYSYTNSAHDIGNVNHIDQFVDHFRYLVGKEKMLRVLMPGRICGIHLMQLTAMKGRDGFIGIKDYRGKTIQMMIDEGWIYHGEVCIDKNPQVQAVRNKERGLLFKSLATDSSVMRMALADYLLLFRKPGENPVPIEAGMSEKHNPGAGWITEEEWIRWARPVWYSTDWMPKDGIEIVAHPDGILEPVWTTCKRDGIHMTDVLNVAQAKDTDDERHLCPLQLGVIERAVKLWSNPGDTVASWFGGVGSEGVRAIELGRKFLGCELKESYWRSAIRNLQIAENSSQQDLFSQAEPANAQA